MARLWTIRPDNTCGRPWSRSFVGRVLLVVMALRTNLTERQTAWIFSTTDSTVDRVVHDISIHLAGLLGPAPVDRRYLWIVDGTLIPTEDHKRSAKSKSYRRSVNLQVVCRRKDRQVVAVGKARPGNRNDVVAYTETVEKVAGAGVTVWISRPSRWPLCGTCESRWQIGSRGATRGAPSLLALRGSS
ncbi:MAG: transposase [Acidimicrobiales bacterium]